MTERLNLVQLTQMADSLEELGHDIAASLMRDAANEIVRLRGKVARAARA